MKYVPLVFQGNHASAGAAASAGARLGGAVEIRPAEKYW
jgi:hypothetical protein